MPSIGGGLAGAAGGFLTGGVPGAILGGLGGLFGSGKSRLQKQVENKINPNLENLTNWSGEAQATGRLLRPIGVRDLGKASGFYEGILDPNDVTAFNSLVGPQRQGINAGYENLKRNLALGIGPGGGARGGGRTSGLMNFEFQKNQEMMNLVPQARMAAAAGLTNVGQAANQAALGFGDLAMRNAGSVLSFAGGSQPNLEAQGAQRGASYADLGSQIGQILGPYLMGKLPGFLGGRRTATRGNAGYTEATAGTTIG